MSNDPRAATAFHEAGHAVAALALGRPVAWASIRPDRKYLGICAFGKGVFRPSEDWIERGAIIALAGPAGEAGFTGEIDWEGARHDHDYAFELARGRGGDDRKANEKVRHLAESIGFEAITAGKLKVARTSPESFQNGIFRSTPKRTQKRAQTGVGASRGVSSPVIECGASRFTTFSQFDN